MKRSPHWIALLALAAGACAQDGFQPLFNGKNLDGWEGDPKLWKVESGVIVGTCDGPDYPEHNTFLIWRAGAVRDFELRATVRVEGDNNSGLQYRSRPLPDVGPWAIAGYQCDIHASLQYNGMTYEEKGRSIIGVNGTTVVIDPEGGRWRVAEREPVVADVSQWTEYTVIARGNHLIHKINGKMSGELIDHDERARALEGLIAIQLHRGKAHTIHVKDILLKPLDPAPVIPFDKSAIPSDATKIEPPRPRKPQGAAGPKP